MKDCLERIKTKYPYKIILLLTDGIEQNPDISDLHTIRRMSWLSFWLFVLADGEDALYFADIVSELDLTKYNKSIKGFVDSPAVAYDYKCQALALCTTICNATGNAEKADTYWARYLVLRLETDKWGEPSDGSMDRKRWKRNLEKGDLVDLYRNKRLNDINKGKKAFYQSACLLEELLWMKEAGGSELYPVGDIEEMIADIVDYLRANIDEVDKDYLKFHIK